MKAKILGALAAGLLVGPMAAHAVTIPSIDIVKKVNGFDADDAASAPTIELGTALTFEYFVTNDGGLSLDNVFVTDDKLGPICSASFLNPGDSFTCTAITVSTATGLQVNIGTASGATLAGVVVADFDSAYYFGGQPVPEPGTLALLGLGLAGLGLSRRRKAN